MKIGLIIFGLLAVCSAPSKAQVPTREFEGIWRYEFEGSTFIEGISKVPLDFDYKSAAWLNYDPSLIAPGPEYDEYDMQAGCYPIYGFRVRFIGKLTVHSDYPFWGATIDVIKMIEARPVPGPKCKRRNPPFEM